MLLLTEGPESTTFQGTIERARTVICGPITLTAELPGHKRTGLSWRGFFLLPAGRELSLGFCDLCHILLADKSRISIVITGREGQLVQFRARGKMPGAQA